MNYVQRCVFVMLTSRSIEQNAGKAHSAHEFLYLQNFGIKTKHLLSFDSHQRLISANVGMSVLVELLDLSYNDITTLDNKCFSVSYKRSIVN